MKTTLLTAAAAFSIITAAAHAESEGAGDAFAFRLRRVYADTGSGGYPEPISRSSKIATADHLDAAPATGSNGTIQTANSVPRGF